jgi:hypothetical protein
MRALAAASALEPFIQPPAQNKNDESAPGEIDTGAAPRFTYMDSVGRIHPLAAIAGLVAPSVPPAQDLGRSIVLQTQSILEQPPSSDLHG